MATSDKSSSTTTNTPGLKKVVILKKDPTVNDPKTVVDKPHKPNKPKKTLIKKEKKSSEKITKPKKIITKKNIYPKLGQTKITPPESDALRKFYTSLLKQNNKSEMAIKWCTEHGLMPKQEDNITYSISKLKL